MLPSSWGKEVIAVRWNSHPTPPTVAPTIASRTTTKIAIRRAKEECRSGEKLGVAMSFRF
jgi:hypothetical protein